MQTKPLCELHALIRSFLEKETHPLIVVLGPTASGKTQCSIAIARSLRTQGREAEVVNADSRQLYRSLDIGTAKITAEEMEGVPHHLIDVLDPKEEATAGWFQREAQEAVRDIHARGAVPILVGGSMLYVSAVIDGLTMAPVPDAALRERLVREYETDGGVSLYRRLQQVDPETAQDVHPHNKPRLVRAVEIFEITRAPKSAAVPQTELRSGARNDQPVTDVSALILGMFRPREELVARINQRTVRMLEDGWIDEVQILLDRGYGPDDPGMKSHGYREIIAHLRYGTPATREELIAVISAQSRQYARRQMTWWKYDRRIHWFTPVLSDRSSAVLPGACVRQSAAWIRRPCP